MKYVLLALLTLSCSHLPSERNPASTRAVFGLPQLLEALARAKDGDVIEIDNKSVFDLSHEETIVIDKAVTLKSGPYESLVNRPHFFSRGKPAPMFRITASKVKFEGLKIEGFETDSKREEIDALNRQGIKGVYKFPITRGIEINASNVMIRNCELSGFSHVAIMITNAQNITIEHNQIHHNQRWGLGYGVSLSQLATAVISQNQFDYNRHSIAGTGHSGQSYEAHHNIFGSHHSDTPLDMHGGKDRKDATQIAGRKIDIHDNEIFVKDVPVFTHRGIAEDGVYIYRNVIHRSNTSKIIGYSNGITNKNLPKNKFRFYDNIFR